MNRVAVDAIEDADRSHSPIQLEFLLVSLIERCGITKPRAERRLNGIENTIYALARPWRGYDPIVPARDLRMSDGAREALLAWIEAEEDATGPTRQRLAVYASGAVSDDRVPAGWVRVTLTP